MANIPETNHIVSNLDGISCRSWYGNTDYFLTLPLDRPVILTGLPGSGKTSAVQAILNDLCWIGGNPGLKAGVLVPGTRNLPQDEYQAKQNKNNQDWGWIRMNHPNIQVYNLMDGYISSSLVEELVKQDTNVLVIDSLPDPYNSDWYSSLVNLFSQANISILIILYSETDSDLVLVLPEHKLLTLINQDGHYVLLSGNPNQPIQISQVIQDGKYIQNDRRVSGIKPFPHYRIVPFPLGTRIGRGSADQQEISDEETQ